MVRWKGARRTLTLGCIRCGGFSTPVAPACPIWRSAERSSISHRHAPFLHPSASPAPQRPPAPDAKKSVHWGAASPCPSCSRSIGSVWPPTRRRRASWRPLKRSSSCTTAPLFSPAIPTTKSDESLRCPWPLLVSLPSPGSFQGCRRATPAPSVSLRPTCSLGTDWPFGSSSPAASHSHHP